ncbi:Hypothetical predicted protein [Octopus vulgaris]|uniref:Uncharacterized protein n=1 Tax=Octopus vulgaris TaxID=6645 RepID=A0AA36BPC7_OCTVU|nr:Hypothetical predicted protein [Octopus vulgaris]
MSRSLANSSYTEIKFDFHNSEQDKSNSPVNRLVSYKKLLPFIQICGFGANLRKEKFYRNVRKHPFRAALDNNIQLINIDSPVAWDWHIQNYGRSDSL